MPAPSASARASSLPIWKIHTEILRTLQSSNSTAPSADTSADTTPTPANRLVLVAPTGSGKTTQVPQMLLDAGLAGTDKMIVVLQPRRVAARTVATRVASERHTPLGAEVGYQIRFDDRTSPTTRIAFVTEGILLRWLQDDRALSNIAAVIFDEFHERNLLSDVALALVKHLQQTQRPDLTILVMSATLDAEPVAAYLGQCPILISEGQSYPVEVAYLPIPDLRPIPAQAADAVARILNDESPGDILVFMPGRGEINATLDALRSLTNSNQTRTRERLAIIPLHGELEPQEQDRAFAPNPLRKVIVATNVAETSITIDGIRHVVDSGLARIARYDAERGIGTLLLEPISRASAEQRKGRAGRTAPGTCHRLWTVINQKDRDERNTPEIQRSDLAEVVLLLHSLGIQEAATFDWLDKPDPQAVLRAERLLTMLGALHEHQGDLTPIGRQMLRLPMHPRYSRMLIEASHRHCVPDAALCAALVSGRDLLTRLDRDDALTKSAREMFEDSDDSDFITLMRAYDFAKATAFNFDRCRAHGINAQVARQVEQTTQQILHAAHQQHLYTPAAVPADNTSPLHPPSSILNRPPSAEPLLRCLMAGFIDQLAKRREPHKPDCDLTDHRQGQIVRETVVQTAPFLVAANLRQAPGRGSVHPQSSIHHPRPTSPHLLLSLATAIQPAWIAEMFPQHLTTTIEHLFDPQNKRIAALRLTRYRDLIIEQKAQQRDLDPIASGRTLAEAHLTGAFDLPLFDHRLKQFIARVNLLHHTLPELEFPAFDQAAITASLTRAFKSLTTVKEAQSAPLLNAFHHHLQHGQLPWLDELLPLTLPWPSPTGGSIKINYLNDTNTPEAQVKVQDCFTLQTHPTLCESRLPVLLSLHTPDGKRLASTTDWPCFLAREWPKHRQTVSKKFPGILWR